MSRIELPITKEQREKIIQQLAFDYVDAAMDDGPRQTLYDLFVDGGKGLNEYSDAALVEEYNDAYGDDEEDRISSEEE